MKKATVLAAMAVCLVLFTGQVRADTTGTISVTVSLEAISVSLNNATWNIGPIALGGTSVLPTVTATNNGNVVIDLKIRGANGNGNWSIGSPAGLNTFVVTLVDPATTLTAVDQVLKNGVATTGTHAINMTYSAPASDDKGAGVDQGFNIVVTASKAP